jgi:hypothetical protein
LNDKVKEEEIGRACSTNEEKKDAYRIFVGIPIDKVLHFIRGVGLIKG